MSTSVIDDQDHSQVQYTGNGSSSSLRCISVYGTIDATSGGVVTSYSVDGALASQVTSSRATGDTYKQLFWQSTALTTGEHNLVVTMVKLNSNPSAGPGEGTIWFDYFQVTDLVQPTPAALPSAPSISQTSTQTPLIPSTTTQTSTQDAATSPAAKSITQSPTQSTSPIPASATQTIIPAVAHGSSKTTHLGGIIGGIVAVVRRGLTGLKKYKQEIERNFYHNDPNDRLLNAYSSVESLDPGLDGADNHSPPSIQPSTSPSNVDLPIGQAVLFYQNQARDPSLSAFSSHPLVSSVSSYTAGASTSQPIGNALHGKGPNPTLTLAWMPEREPIQHVDSGVRNLSTRQGVRPMELPPVYSAQ
ncbi:hypothetical protein GALMADRAFT_1363854 [Galerina marginata CBS 339.88]|uniref:Uncharacterized protein n=1 Tax=Galerina marginata (strain CBS 339.88) TaxID=685588 RepID=A0A067TAU6_GALM3|nr:hypothetical protein GALMADRAFT_1363854 [Galerina marginata CBS 339.88]